jgi:hypothetical protein
LCSTSSFAVFSFFFHFFFRFIFIISIFLVNYYSYPSIRLFRVPFHLTSLECPHSGSCTFRNWNVSLSLSLWLSVLLLLPLLRFGLRFRNIGN